MPGKGIATAILITCATNDGETQLAKNKLYLVFIDLVKAFDMVPREGMRT